MVDLVDFRKLCGSYCMQNPHLILLTSVALYGVADLGLDRDMSQTVSMRFSTAKDVMDNIIRQGLAVEVQDERYSVTEAGEIIWREVRSGVQKPLRLVVRMV